MEQGEQGRQVSRKDAIIASLMATYRDAED